MLASLAFTESDSFCRLRACSLPPSLLQHETDNIVPQLTDSEDRDAVSCAAFEAFDDASAVRGGVSTGTELLVFYDISIT